MDMTGEYRIPAPRQRVWEALNDPEVLRQALPGCEPLDKVTDTVLLYDAKADVGGKLAQIGSRLIQGTAKKMSDDFFGRFSRIVAESYAGATAPAAPRLGTAPTAA